MTGPKSYAVRAHVQAWQVTADNLEQVAAWCEGRPATIEQCIDFPDARDAMSTAEVGDWIVRGYHGFFALPDSSFREHYYRDDPPAPVVRGCLTGEPLRVARRGATL